jgi:hypothetical protein
MYYLNGKLGVFYLVKADVLRKFLGTMDIA